MNVPTTAVARRQSVEQSIARAAQRTGVDFGYLLRQARSESGLDPTIQASTSSAAGLYQFIDQSWLGVMKQHGAKHGYAWASDAIERSGSRWTVRDAGMRQAVFALRKDADAASLMAGEFASDNADGLAQALGRIPGAGDLYFAHFLGLSGATRFLKAAQAAPDSPAAPLFPREAAVNRTIFYTRAGTARSLAEVYQLMSAKVEGGALTPVVPDDDAFGEGVLMADGQPLTRTPPGGNPSRGPRLEVQMAGLLSDGNEAKTPLQMMREADERRRAMDLLRPDPSQAKLAYMLVMSTLA